MAVLMVVYIVTMIKEKTDASQQEDLPLVAEGDTFEDCAGLLGTWSI